jgi:hypothetical protein
MKTFKNRPRLPRTAGLRTLSELTVKMTAAGLDPSRIQERAAILAKAQGAERKRKRDEAEDGMDVDAEDEGDEGDWMDVGDEGEGTPKKKRKADSGAVTVKRKRVPASNRQLAGMRDAAVRSSPVYDYDAFILTDRQQAAKAIQLRNLSQRERNRQAKAGESDRAIKTKMVCHRLSVISRFLTITVSQNIFSLESGRVAKQIGGEGPYTLQLGGYFFAHFFAHTCSRSSLLHNMTSLRNGGTAYLPFGSNKIRNSATHLFGIKASFMKSRIPLHNMTPLTNTPMS